MTRPGSELAEEKEGWMPASLRGTEAASPVTDMVSADSLVPNMTYCVFMELAVVAAEKGRTWSAVMGAGRLPWAAALAAELQGFRLFIYLLGGVTSDTHLSRKSRPSALLAPHRAVLPAPFPSRVASIRAVWLPSEPCGFHQSRVLSALETTFNFFLRQGPELPSPFLRLACLLSLNRCSALGVLLGAHPFHAPLNEAQWLSAALCREA